MNVNISKVKENMDKLGNYGLYVGDMQALHDEALKGGANYRFMLILFSYTYGFMRGQNAEKNQRRKAQQRGA